MIAAPDFTDWLDLRPFQFGSDQKEIMMKDALLALTQWHQSFCSEYKKIIDLFDVDLNNIRRLEDIPFIPVRLFKEFDLRSISADEIFKTMTSSGTSGQEVSKIYLDRYTASLQTKILSKIMSDLLGSKRLPMLVIDSPSVVKNRRLFSARGAGILGFSMFGHDVTYALDEVMAIDWKAITDFLARHTGEPIFVFGFTFMIWQYFVLPLLRENKTLSLENAILLHGGGWKKLSEQAVDNETFKSTLRTQTGLKKVVNYYGMVEQTGSIAIECDQGNLHVPIYSDVVVREPGSFAVVKNGEEGIIETLSILPRSYPGHALLTEDLGVILGEDDCPCGRLGKYFQVNGRLARAEIRGCSDTHEAV